VSWGLDLALLAGAAWVLALVSAGGARWASGVVASSGFSAVGGVLAAASGVVVIAGGRPGTLALESGVAGSFLLRTTPLAAVFLVALGLVATAIGLYGPRYHAPGTGTSVYQAAYALALVASLGVLLAGSVTTFLVAWEAMTVAGYLIILRHPHQVESVRGGYRFLALGEIGFLLAVGALGLLAVRTGTLDFSQIAARAQGIPPGFQDAIYLLALAGFGFKAGIVPFHVWLPEAHPVAPADGSGFLSGVITKLGVYGFMLVAFELLPRGPVWWGLLALALGGASAVLGVLYSLMERDWKRFLAFSTIENIGIVIMAVGASLTFFESGQAALGGLLFIAALYQVLNHAAYKTLLFLEVGVVEHASGSRDLDRLGGLARRMPRAAILMLIGSLGIAALPPLNGFVSEWLLFQGLFQGFRIGSHLVAVLLVVAAAGLALTGGLAVNAFARSFGLPFLGMARSRGASEAQEQGQPWLGAALLAGACVFLAIGAPLVLQALSRVAAAVVGVRISSLLVVPGLTIIPAHTNFSSLSPTWLAVCLIAMLGVPFGISLVGRGRHADRQAPVWAGGMLSFRSRMQYTATTFANPVRVTFDRLYRPSVQVARASDDPAGQSGPVHYGFRVFPVFERSLYQPVATVLNLLGNAANRLQSGNVNAYLLYVFVAVLLAYAAALL
jgi:hydrogenase-4 component B